MQRLPLLLAFVFLSGFGFIEFLPAQTSSPPVTRIRTQNRAVSTGYDRDNYVIPKLEYPNADVLSILRIYEELTGKKLVYDNTVQGQVNIVISTPVTKEEAIKIIEINLILNGFSIVPAEGDIVKVLGISKNPRSAGVPIYNSDEELPEGDQVVSMLFKLQYAAPDELSQLLSQYIAPQAWTSVVPLVKSQSILITENTSVLSGIRKIIRQVDVPPAEVTSEFIALQRADAEDVIEKLRNIFNPEESPERSRTVPPPNRNAVTGAAPIGRGQREGENQGATLEIGATRPNEDSLIVGKILLTADVRTNRIHVVTRPINMPFVRDLIWQFDSEVSFGQPTARPLRYVSAGDILDMIVQAISEKGIETEGAADGATGAAAPRETGVNQSFNTNLGGTTSGSGGGLNVSEGLSTEPTDTTPLAVTVGNSRIIADRRSNAIIVIANNDVKEKVFQLIEEIDVRAPQVLLNTVIGELTLSENFELGVDYLYRSEDSIVPVPQPSTTTNPDGTVVTNPVSTAVGSAFAGISRTTTAPLLDAAAIGSAAGFGQLANIGGLTAFLAPIDELQIIVRALEATSRFRVTSRPTVFTSNNKKAIIVSGQEVAVPVSSVSAFTAGTAVPSVQSNIQFKSIALQLEVVPLINDNGDVSLDILQKVDSISGESVIDGNSIPTIATRYIRTNVLVPDRGVVYLGGLIKTELRKGQRGIPYLNRIPLLGRLFRTDTKDEVRSELIVLLRPEVTRGPRELAVLRENEEEMLVIESDLDQTLYPEGKRRVSPGSGILRPPAMPPRGKY